MFRVRLNGTDLIVAFENSISFAKFALTLALLYHRFHVMLKIILRTVLSALRSRRALACLSSA